MHAGKNQLRAGRSDVDPNAGQRNAVLPPQRILLKRPLVGEIVIVIGKSVMNVIEIQPQPVIGKRVWLGRRRVAAHSLLIHEPTWKIHPQWRKRYRSYRAGRGVSPCIVKV